MTKKIIIFIIAAAVSLLAATHRWSDSAHAIGLISENGGKARHAITLESGEERYMLIATATVLPPYRGDVKVVLEGEPAADYEIHASGPIVDLGFHRWPEFRGDTFYGLQPKDRPALWVAMKPPVVDPVCGMHPGPSSVAAVHAGKTYRFCSDECRTAFLDEPEQYRNKDHARGNYTLAFYDTKTGKPVLTIPVTIQGKGEAADAAEHHH